LIRPRKKLLNKPNKFIMNSRLKQAAKQQYVGKKDLQLKRVVLVEFLRKPLLHNK